MQWGVRSVNLFPAELCQKFDELGGVESAHNVYRTVLRPHVNGNGVAARESIVNLAVAPLVFERLTADWALNYFRRHHRTATNFWSGAWCRRDKAFSSIGLLAAGVAHEVNTPLAVISTYAQMLAKQVSGDDQKAKLLDKIAKQTFRASEIVNSLLNFSRTSPTDFAEVDLNRIIRETASLVEHQFQKAGVATDLALAENLPSIRGNSGKLQQVFLNLFINARDAMAEGGLLTVRSQAESGYAVIEVMDTGQGIPAEHLARIYDPFFTTKGPKKGTGLGLSISYGIVHEHDGLIEVDSAVGGGTRFRLNSRVWRCAGRGRWRVLRKRCRRSAHPPVLSNGPISRKTHPQLTHRPISRSETYRIIPGRDRRRRDCLHSIMVAASLLCGDTKSALNARFG